METPAYQPIFVPTKTAVLLVFMPGQPPDRRSTEGLLQRVQGILGNAVRITKVETGLHPDVVSTFGVQSFPSFVLVKRGVEVWRHSGLIDRDELILLLSGHLGMAGI
ncbi:thioredoxin family protein [Larkinella soli]|uniref:thioredoxin family protein n=1 Tax=Larkinella soli TaxID=1770527 RepID=UPI0013E3AC35|nr:thioredoxin family protein [Larkinella soli]